MKNLCFAERTNQQNSRRALLESITGVRSLILYAQFFHISITSYRLSFRSSYGILCPASKHDLAVQRCSVYSFACWVNISISPRVEIGIGGDFVFYRSARDCWICSGESYVTFIILNPSSTPPAIYPVPPPTDHSPSSPDTDPVSSPTSSSL